MEEDKSITMVNLNLDKNTSKNTFHLERGLSYAHQIKNKIGGK